jgi:hypothetical protein
MAAMGTLFLRAWLDRLIAILERARRPPDAG